MNTNHAAKRRDLLKNFAAAARDADRRNDATARREAANDWRQIATAAEAKRAPLYLDWYGR